MNTTTREYRVGDLSIGVFAIFEDEAVAQQALQEAIEDGININLESMGEEGCPWATDEDAMEAARSFFYVNVVDVTRDEEGDIIDENYVSAYQW